MAQKGQIKKPVNSNVVKAGGKYVIPKKRRVIKQIQINNGVLTAEVEEGAKDNWSEVYWFRNGKYITPSMMDKYKFHDKSNRIDVKLSHYAHLDKNKNLQPGLLYQAPSVDKIAKAYRQYQDDISANVMSQQIPLNDNTNWITLKTRNEYGKPGRMNLADIPENMLDSIAVNAGRSNTDFWTDAALVGKESTFGGFSDLLYQQNPLSYKNRNEYIGSAINPMDLVNNHAYEISPYDDYITALRRQYPLMTGHSADSVSALEKNAKYAIENGLIRANTKKYSNYVLADAFKRYAENPYRYNPGQKNYVPMLNDIRYELSGEKQLQDYWNTRGQYEYARGRKEGISEPEFDDGKEPADDNYPVYYPTLLDTNYDQARAQQLGYVRGANGHYNSRDYRTGDILKYPSHPTFGMALYKELKSGYLPVKRRKGKLKANTQPTPMRQWMDRTFNKPMLGPLTNEEE